MAPGQTTTCNFTNEFTESPTGTFTLSKNTSGGFGAFSFTGNTGITSLTTTSANNPASQTVTLPVGTYNAQEVVPPGWLLTCSSCTSGTPSSFNITAGQTLTCTFNDNKIPTTGTFTLSKNTSGGFGSFSFTGNTGITSLTTTSANNPASQTVTLPVGTYNAQEVVPPGWLLTGSSCTSGAPSSFNITAGQTVTCTFNDNKIPTTGTFTLSKNTSGGFGAFSFTGNTGITSLTTTSANNPASQTVTLPVGTYNVQEVVPPGWLLTGSSCTSGAPSSFSITAGQTVTCTFNDNKIPTTGT